MLLKLTSLVLLVAFGLSTQAQTEGARCDFSSNPHSFDCNAETFDGIHFPVLQISNQRFQGQWKLFTFASNEGNETREFRMNKNARNPRIPEGVVNRTDGTEVGPLMWFGNAIEMFQWKVGHESSALIRSGITAIDAWTLQIKLSGPQGLDAFQCRIFVRKQTDHLLCRWFEHRGEWKFRGYLGFLLE